MLEAKSVQFTLSLQLTGYYNSRKIMSLKEERQEYFIFSLIQSKLVHETYPRSPYSTSSNQKTQSFYALLDLFFLKIPFLVTFVHKGGHKDHKGGL